METKGMFCPKGTPPICPTRARLTGVIPENWRANSEALGALQRPLLSSMSLASYIGETKGRRTYSEKVHVLFANLGGYLDGNERYVLSEGDASNLSDESKINCTDYWDLRRCKRGGTGTDSTPP